MEIDSEGDGKKCAETPRKNLRVLYSGGMRSGSGWVGRINAGTDGLGKQRGSLGKLRGHYAA